MLACVCMSLIFLCALIKVILHKTSRVLLVCFQVRLAARVHFQAIITICDNWGLVRDGNILITYNLTLFSLDFGDGEGVRELS